MSDNRGHGLRVKTGRWGNTIIGNHVRDNSGYGIWCASGDAVTQNFVGGHATNYPTAGANIAPVQNISTSTNPWANIGF